ncbi:MAG: hypothetical protein VKN13_09155 [Cyanobacteriota bacterium]|nr:hypothetical protein [Cyanobacteriota bacterium]
MQARFLAQATMLMVTILGPTSALASRSDTPGRWQGTTGRCEVVIQSSGDRPPSASSCQLLRVEQRQQGLLTIRFVGDARPNLGQTTTFAGILVTRATALRCSQDRCQLVQPIQLRVSAVGRSSVNLATNGASSGSIQARIAQGHCQLARRRVQCQAEDDGGFRWQASATL